VTIWHTPSGGVTTQETLLWDRKRDGGFPGMLIITLSLYSGPGVLGSLISSASGLKLTYLAEVKALKSLVRNVIAPERDLGHTDRALKKAEEDKQKQEIPEGKKECEDCQ